MRVNMLRVIAVAMAVTLLDVSLFGYQLLPDVAGLAVLFFCAVLMTDQAKRFARAAVVAAVMLFLEVVRIFNLTVAAPVVGFLGLLYMFLTVLLVITVADGVGQFGQLHGQENIAKLSDVTGHIYAATFIFSVLAVWFSELSSVFGLLNIMISLFVIIMFLYFYSAVYVTVQPPYDPPAMTAAEGEEETPSDEENGEEAVPAAAETA